MKQARQSFESQWDQVIETVLPRYRKFGQTSDSNPGDKRTQDIFDSTPMLALRHFAAAMDSMITPRTQKWHGLTVSDPDLRDNPAIKKYLETVTDILFSHRYRWRANFASQSGESYVGYGAFGAGGIMIDDVLGQGIRYRNLRMNRLWFAEDAFGVVDKAHIVWTLTARQAAQKWGAKSLPLFIRNALDHNDLERKFDFLHAIRPRRDREYGKVDARNLPIQSVWIPLTAESQIVEHGGFRVFPAAIGRFYAADDSAYGYSPAMEALPDTRMLNRMEKTNIKGAEKAVDPPLVLADDGALEAFDLRSGALNFGYLNEQGTPLVQPLNLGKNVPLGSDYASQKRESINLAFYVTLFQILVDNHQMTATEVLQRAQEKGILLGPTMGRVQSEQLGAQISRELDILNQAGALPPMPPELEEAGGVVEVEYNSPLNQAMRAEEGTSLLRLAEASAPFVQADPSAARVFDGVKILRRLADVFSVPSECLRTDDDLAEQDAAAAQQQQAAQLLEAAPVAAGAAKDLSSAALNASNARI
ncbi:portal protein [Bordetella tumbae]|uniref:portal protein n=1 Tax=Bordetella tumbae TaxID=1649139 RepID=UPI0039EFB43D